MKVNGWQLYQYKLFTDELNRLTEEVKTLQKSQPDTFQAHPKTKRLARIKALMLKEIPEDPAHVRWSQGKTLGIENRLWKRAKFGQNRFRLFFRYDSSAKVIIYAWVNNEDTLRTYGDKNDAYAIFAKGLKNGNPPSDLKELLKLCSEVVAQPAAVPKSEDKEKYGPGIAGNNARWAKAFNISEHRHRQPGSRSMSGRLVVLYFAECLRSLPPHSRHQ